LQRGNKPAGNVAPAVAPTTGRNLTTAGNNWQEPTKADDPRQAELIALWNMASETARAAIYATAKAVTEGLRNGFQAEPLSDARNASDKRGGK